MDSQYLGWIPTCITITCVILVLFLREFRSYSGSRANSKLNFDNRDTPSSNTIEEIAEKKQGNGRDRHKEDDNVQLDELRALKRLYYQLHNLEKFPEVLPLAKKLLLAFLWESNSATQTLPEHENIRSVPSFSRQNLEEFQHKRDNSIGQRWEQYNIRRKGGSDRELFQDRQEAIWWLKQISPVKYVDGAWLGYIGKVTTPFALQKIMKGAWQILSEELGDGDLEKNHVHLYHKLLKSIASGLPAAESLDFGHPRHELNTVSVWKSAIAQLLISLFPEDFLPEILGFNLHFEAISTDTLKAAKELREVGIDSYYFILHISIDNAHSGHTAIAVEIVCEYMDHIRRTEGEEAAQRAWSKIQAGYLLSSGLPGTVVCPSSKREIPVDGVTVRLSPTEKQVIEIFQAKAQVVSGIHCGSRVKIGCRSVVDWLNPIALQSKEWQIELLDSLSSSKYWINKGDSSGSRFMRELQWNGRMFGSFTHDEYNILRQWIDGLINIPLALEESQMNHAIDAKDCMLFDFPGLKFQSIFSLASIVSKPYTDSFSFGDLPILDVQKKPVMESFLPLWLSHPCLLQTFVSVPFRTKSKLGCTIVKVLRAQKGFDIEQDCVAGMGEFRRPDSLGLLGIGANMITQHGLSLAEAPSLTQILQIWPSEFALNMLHISLRPLEFQGMLIGMATAFAKLHAIIAESQLNMLSDQDRHALLGISRRELEGLEVCWKELEIDDDQRASCCAGYLAASHEIEKCFHL